MTSLRSLVLLVAAVAVAGAAAGLAGAVIKETPRDDALTKVTTQASPSPSQPLASTAPTPHLTQPAGGGGSGAHPHPELDDDYVSCARGMGFNPGTVDVMLDRTEKPMGVFSTYEVPARVHGPCLKKLGGDDLSQSSYGNPPVFVTPSR